MAATTRQDLLGSSTPRGPGPPAAASAPLRILQLSDPHLLADPAGQHRGIGALAALRHGLAQALAQLAAAGIRPDRLLLSGDLCQDESWGGYVRLRELLEQQLPAGMGPPLLLAGNHDQPQLLRAALGRRARIAPGLWILGGAANWGLLALDSHCSGRDGGRLDGAQWNWLERLLAERPGSGGGGPAGGPLLVALHHPPLALGDPMLDAIGLEAGGRLVQLLAASTRVRGVVFGHAHQHWQGSLAGRADVPLLGCPSSLCSFRAVQPCPLGRSADPGGRLLELGGDGEIRHQLLRWQSLDPP